jgi:hypothetical protein
MITREQSEKLRMGDRLVAYRRENVRIGEATPLEFELAVVIGVARNRGLEAMADAVGSANGCKECGEPRIKVAFADGSTQTLRGGRLFFGAAYAADAVREDIVSMIREHDAIEAAWAAYFKADAEINSLPEHPNFPPGALETRSDPQPEHGFGDETLHRLWTKAVGTEGYDKTEWLKLEALVHYGIAQRRAKGEP